MRTNLARDVVPDIHLFVIEQHAIDGLDSTVGSVCGLVMDEAVSL